MHINLTLTQTVNVAKPVYKDCVHMYTTLKQIELESPGCSGFEANSQNSKTCATRVSSSICLEVVYMIT